MTFTPVVLRPVKLISALPIRTELFVERTTPHAPTNVTVTDSETFAVTIEWMPGYSGCASCKQTYKIRYQVAAIDAV